MNGKQEVWEGVESFRAQYLAEKGDLLPVDVLALAEIDLGLDIIPVDDLFEKYGIDAALTLDFTGIYVDAESYIVWETGPLWKQHRLRFSIAHELGHYVLHRDIAAQQKFLNFQDFFHWCRHYGGNKYTLEQCANEFGGRLLVPRNRLEDHFSRMAKEVQHIFPDWRSSGEFLRSFSSQINNDYGVTQKVIEVRLEREGLWIVN
jgi:Zn-dependent peptidase ImmA (M78 family)